MTETLEQTQIAVRTFEATITPGEGRTVDLRIVPYGERATANDGLGGLPAGVAYEEEIMEGCFDHVIPAANRVLLNFEHQQGLAGVVGHGVALRSVPGDGFHGSFKMHETSDGEKTLMLVREGVLRGASFEAIFRRSVRAASGVVQRFKADLRQVAVCREPAYAGAVVLGVRTPAILEEEFLPTPFDPELAARIEALGLEVPDRLKTAHLAPGTPDSGTPETTPAIDDNDNETEK